MGINKNKMTIVILGAMLLLALISLNGCGNLDETSKALDEPSKPSDLSYYKEELQDRYEAYQKANEEMSLEDLVTYVNMGIDREFYDDDNIRPQKSPEDLNTIVNKVYKLEEDWAPTDLVWIENSTSREPSQQMRKEAAAAFLDFREAVFDKTGVRVNIHSGYRSTDYQRRIFDNMTRVYGKEHADTVSSRPGHSEHTTGLACDISLDDMEFTSIHNHAKYKEVMAMLADYGFVLRYPEGKEKLTGYSYESWHIRYLGKELAQKVKDSGLTYDEYYAQNF